MNTISNSDDVIDSRDIIARIEELESTRDNHLTTCEVCKGATVTEEGVGCGNCDEGQVADPGEWAEENPDDAAELATLKSLAEEAEGYSEDWTYGATLIRDSYFKDYARELAQDLGDYKDDMRWPHSCIDWAQAAEELQQDYTSVDFDGVTYWVR